MGNDNTFDDASHTECDLVGSDVHLPAQKAEPRRQGQIG